MAASAVKIASNRENATHSTGPVDTSRTRFNGLAHGLTSKQTVLPGENQGEYDRFAAGLRKELRPQSAIENVLTDRLISAAWRLQRFTRIETAFLANRIDAFLEARPQADADVAMANLFIDPAETARMRLFMRYQTAVQREYDKAFQELQAAKKERRKRQLEEAALGVREDITEFGFVSQSNGAEPARDSDVAETLPSATEARPSEKPNLVEPEGFRSRLSAK